MSTMAKHRIFHLFLAGFALSAYFLTHGWGVLHAWLGMSVAALVIFRLLWSRSKAPQLALKRFKPDFSGINRTNMLRHAGTGRALILGIALCFITSGTTGLLLDNAHAFEPARITATFDKLASFEKPGRLRLHQNGAPVRQKRNPVLKEVHEISGNLFIGLAVLHILYQVLVRWQLARYMLFFPKPKRQL